MDGTEKVVGEGTYTGESCKGGKLELTIKKGDRINILRMHNNPVGKWLAKTEDGKGKICYLHFLTHTSFKLFHGSCAYLYIL